MFSFDVVVVPMFHCNGWCFPWTMAGIAGTSFLLSQIKPDVMFSLINKFVYGLGECLSCNLFLLCRYNIQFICGAPITMNTLLNYRGPERVRFNHAVRMWVGGSPPPAVTIRRIFDELNIKVTTIYGLTETYGVATSATPDPEWAGRTDDTKLEYSIIQCGNIGGHSVTVRNSDTLEEVAADGKTVGEVMFRGNNVMKGTDIKSH
jgi:fatty-acyl-CoA synthase